MTINNPPILLRDAFPDWANGGGIFDAIISTAPSMPEWEYADFYDEYCPPDFEYFGNHSGYKKCSPLVYSLLTDGVLYDSARYKLARIINNKFFVVWRNRYYSFSDDVGGITRLEGDTNIIISRTEAKTRTGSITRDDDFSETKTTQYGKTVSTSDTSAQSTYGYNSSQDTPTDKETASGNTQTRGTDTDSIQNARDFSELNSGSDSLTGSETRSGLTGNRSKQEIIKQDRELWYADFFTSVYRDVDSILALPIYNRRHPVNPYAYPYHGYPVI